MATYSTFFLSEQKHLPAAFPEWKLPLAQAVTRKSINPFTGEEITISTRAPEWDDFDPENLKMPEYQVVAMDGDYEQYIEQRIPLFVQSQPHWCTKNLTCVEMEPLVASALDIDEAKLESALYAPPSTGAGIEQFPTEFVAYLRNTEEASLRRLADKWAKRMSTPDYTHSLDGERLYDDWTVEDALSILTPLVDLSKRQRDGQLMYLLIEG